MANGNGITFDYSSDSEFKAFCVQKLTLLEERTSGLEALKTNVTTLQTQMEDVEGRIKDTAYWNNVKLAIAPVLVAAHAIARKLGWSI